MERASARSSSACDLASSRKSSTSTAMLAAGLKPYMLSRLAMKKGVLPGSRAGSSARLRAFSATFRFWSALSASSCGHRRSQICSREYHFPLPLTKNCRSWRAFSRCHSRGWTGRVPRLERTCNVEEVFPDRRPWNVQDFTLAEVRQLDCGSWYVQEDPFQQIAAGNVSASDLESYKGERAPTLREALEFTRDNHWAVNIEIKEQPDDATAALAVEKTVALVTELGMDDGRQVVISSFEHAYLRQVRALNNRIPIQLLTNADIQELDQYLNAFDTKYVNPKVTVWNPEQLKEMSARGVLINVWTVNEEADLQAMIDANVNGIITDFPQRLRQLLQ